MLDGQDVVAAALGYQVAGVLTLGVQGIGSDDRPADVDAVQQFGQHRYFVGLGLHIDLAQDHAVRVIERGEQVPAGFCAAG
jgi:hypothetical protein